MFLQNREDTGVVITDERTEAYDYITPNNHIQRENLNFKEKGEMKIDFLENNNPTGPFLDQ